MADDDEEAKVPAKSGGKLWMIIAIFVFALLIGAGIFFLLMGSDGGGEGQGVKKGVKKHVETKPAIYFELERFVVNIGKQKRSKYLQVNMQVLARDEKIIEQVKLHTPKIRNNLIFLLSGQDAVVIADNEGKEQLRLQSLKEIQSILQKETGSPGIEDLFFTSFIMQ